MPTINGIPFPDDASEAEILSFFEAHQDLVGDGAESPSRVSEPAGPPVEAKGEHPHARTARLFADLASTIGAGVGGALGMAGGPAGAIAGAGLGGAAGQGVKRLTQAAMGDRDLSKETPASVGADLGVEGLKQAAWQAVGLPVAAGIAKVGSGMQGLARRAMKGAIKPDRGYLEKMAGARRGGINAMENEIVDTALTERVNPVRKGGLDKLQGVIEDTAATRQRLIRNAPDAPISGQARGVERSLAVEAGRAARGTAPQSRVASIQRLAEDVATDPGKTTSAFDAAGELVTRPRNLRPTELAENIEQDNNILRGLFGGQDKAAEIGARLRVQRANTASLDRAAGTGEASRKMKRLIDLRNVGNIALRRSESTNPINLTDIISLSAGRPGVLAGSIGMKAPILAELSLLANRGGAGLTRTGAPLSREATRALLALMASHGDTEP